MKLSCNMIKICEEYGLKKMIDVLLDCGFDGIDFNNDLEEYCGNLHDKEYYLDLKKYAEEKGFSFFQAHAPFPSSFSSDTESEKRFNEIVWSMRNASYLGVPMIVVHPCYHLEDATYQENFDYNLNFYKRLAPFAKEYDIKIAIENIPVNYPNNACDNANKINALYDKLNQPEVFTVCFDVGHSMLSTKNPAEEIKKIGYRIGCTHIHDNNGLVDAHTLPYSGVIDWEGVMKALADINYKGELNYEASLFFKNVPIKLREDSLRYMAKVGKYLISLYENYKKTNENT